MGASWVSENILQQHPDADLRVYAIWVPGLPTDARSEWNRNLLPDPRVRHFWDDRSAVAWELGLAPLDRTVYDVYAVFGPDARWGDDAIASGETIIGRADDLRAALVPLLR